MNKSCTCLEFSFYTVLEPTGVLLLLFVVKYCVEKETVAKIILLNIVNCTRVGPLNQWPFDESVLL